MELGQSRRSQKKRRTIAAYKTVAIRLRGATLLAKCIYISLDYFEEIPKVLKFKAY